MSAIEDVWGDTSARSTTRQKSGIRYTSDGTAYQANPSNIVQRFRAIDARDDTFGNPLPELDLPGFGEKYDDCGDEIPRFCADCGATHTVGRTCYRSTCPRCGKSWARKRGASVAAKLEAVRRYEESKRDGWAGYKFHHLMASPPAGYETFSQDSLDRTFEALKEVMDEIGAPTGVMVYHPYRGDDEEPGDDRGKWKSRLFSGRDWKEVRRELKFSPHFHIIVVAKQIDGGHVTRAVEEKTGWLIHRITKGESNVSIYDEYDLTRVTQYTLSHAGLYETEETTRAAYRYFGRAANLSPTDEIAAKMDAAARSTAPKILGLPWSDLACQEDRGDRPPQSPLVASTSAAEPGSGDGDGDGRFESDSDDAPDGTCAGRLLDITKAPAFLDDAEWCEKAPRSDELRETWNEWREKVDGPPPD